MILLYPMTVTQAITISKRITFKDPCLECCCKPCNKSDLDGEIEGAPNRQTMKTGMGGFAA